MTETSTAAADPASQETPPAAPSATPAPAPAAEPETYPRAYVERLRAESADHRKAAGRADTLARQAATALADRDGRLRDTRDLAYDAAWLGDDGLDPGKVTAAIDALLADRPHLARPPRPAGDVGQGARPEPSAAPGLAGMLRAGA